MDYLTSVFGFVNLVSTSFLLYLYLLEYRGSIFEMFFRWKLVDLIYITLNFILCFFHVGVFLLPHYDDETKDPKLEWERTIFTVIILLECTRLLYYLKLYTWFAHYIEIFIDIIEVMIPFSFMIILMIMTFAAAFFMLGRNQIQYDNKVNPAKEPDYATTYGSLWEIFNVCMGNPGFAVGDYKEDAFFLNHEFSFVGVCLLIIFIITCFVLLLNLLNMLIAIMSDAFQKNSEKIDQIMIQARLCFIIDKWELRKYLLNLDDSDTDEKADKKGRVPGIKYVVCAFIQEQDKNNKNLIKQIQNDLKESSNRQINFENDMFNTFKDMK